MRGLIQLSPPPSGNDERYGTKDGKEYAVRYCFLSQGRSLIDIGSFRR
jgi:hypothetical protein